MRWFAALALLVLVVLTVRGAMHSTHRGVPAIPERPELPAVDPRPSAPPPRTPRPPSGPRPRSGVARVQGTVRPAQGTSAEERSHLSVDADDGTRVFGARVLPGDRFTLTLPPGSYTLIASLGTDVGTVEVTACAGETREIDIQLGPGAAITGHVKLPAGQESDVEVTARFLGGLGSFEGTLDDDGNFEILGLIPGRRYDLAFTSPRLRAGSLREVPAPSDGLELSLERLPVLRGAVGFPRGQRCPITTVAVQEAVGSTDSDSIDEGGAVQHLEPDCRFELSIPDDVSIATVVAQGPGWHLEEQVPIPVRGDPPWLCLNPPCRENPTEGLARLRIELEGAGAGAHFVAEVTSTDETSTHYHSCGSKGGACVLADLPAGETFEVEGHSNDCRSQPRKIVLVSGDNVLRLPCPRQQVIEGVIHVNGSLPPAVLVRCPDRPAHPFSNTRLFQLECPADVRRLEYQAEPEGAWHAVELPEASSDPVFVEITL